MIQIILKSKACDLYAKVLKSDFIQLLTMLVSDLKTNSLAGY